ncbi:MAG TPA: packaged DNA stabilization gp4 family protein, partial [Acidovorax sp.]|nr:packaged DNA stabilization gp4 family protein [Acidovorax sp.]
MAKYADAVKRSLRLIQVINPTQQVSASDMQTGIEVLNSMLTRWEADGVALGWAPSIVPDDELSVPDEAIEAVVYNLALRLCPEYGVEPMPVVVAGAQVGMAALERDI